MIRSVCRVGRDGRFARGELGDMLILNVRLYEMMCVWYLMVCGLGHPSMYSRLGVVIMGRIDNEKPRTRESRAFCMCINK